MNNSVLAPLSYTEGSGDMLIKSDKISCPHGFTTRFGGVSSGIYESLNLAESQGDTKENVRRNYELLAQAAGFDLGSLVFTRQVHENKVRIVTKADSREPFREAPPAADGLVTNEMKLPLIIFTADCVPVLLCDSRNKVIGAVHAGWRSSVADILKNALEAMLSLGARAGDISAAIGPAIGYCCFEVGPEVIEAVEKYLGGDTGGLYRKNDSSPGKYFLNLKGANERRLLQLGLNPGKIDVSPDCTMCRADVYWSHRATAGQRGSQASVIYMN